MNSNLVKLAEFAQLSDFNFVELLKVLHIMHKVSPNHPFISVLQPFSFKLAQEGLDSRDVKNVLNTVNHFVLLIAKEVSSAS
jgi:hypothetical protein|nr:MAG TPA: hypothetical protein [Caudoviricetes sp.]